LEGAVRVYVGSCLLVLLQGDVTEQAVDLITNAANSALAGGGGVDGAIHRRGGPTIMAETRRRFPDGCPTGSAVITAAGKLSARYVAHAVGPIWDGGQAGEAELLAAAYRTVLAQAIKLECRSMAFPALSAGAYGYPLREAAHVALSTTLDILTQHGRPEEVRFVLFDQRAFSTFAEVLTQLTNGRKTN
jgi:O-acetyl-ADP-ribose deacetylase (regulator of RNase III)